MDAERWHRIETLFADAVARSGEVRAAYLAGACADDHMMRAEVESLLEAHAAGAETFLEPGTLAKHVVERDPQPPLLTPGVRLGAFEIIAALDAGGMGAVYEARDTRLDRSVALKLLAPRFDLVEHGFKRFEREARAISRLAHPHICTLYDIARASLPPDGEREVEFLVMELVRGETLAAVIARGPLPEDLVVRYATEMADALACAHREGIVHRDLKPQNIMITAAGLKLLDFGLAAFTHGAAMGPPGAAPTEPRVIAGTAQYMAPEQVRGEVVDGRADIFSLGVVIHEMLTGARPFDRPTTLETLHAILNEPSRPLPAVVPGELRSIVEKCLRKDRRQRVQQASDVGLAVRALRPEGDRAGGDTHRSWASRALQPRRVSPRALGAGLAVLAIALTGLWFARQPPVPTVTRYVRLTNDAHLKTGGLVTDGSRLYLSELVNNQPMIVQVSTGGGDSSPLPVPFPRPQVDDISPDGAELFVGSFDGRGPFPYWAVPLGRGAPPRPLPRAHDVHPSPDGRQIAYVVTSDVYVSLADGTAARRIATLPGKFPGSLAWAPDGRRLRFTLVEPQTGQSSIWEIAPDGTGLRPVLAGWNTPAAVCCGRWTPDGALFIFQARRDGFTRLWALREKGRWWRRSSSVPVQLTDGPLHFRSPTPGRDGRTIFAIGEQVRGEIMRRESGSGEWTPFTLGTKARSMTDLAFAPDGQWVAYVDYPDGTLWRSRVDGTDDHRLTPPSMIASSPEWAPDGSRIAFEARVGGGPGKIHVVSARGGTPEPLMTGHGGEAAPAWSPDGHRIVFGGSPFFDPSEGGPPNLRMVDVRTRQVTAVPGSEGMWAARWSPDGRYIVAHRFEFAQLMLLEVATGRWEELASGVRSFARWSRDSQYVMYESWTEDTAVIRIRVADRRRETIGTLKAYRRSIGPERCWSGLAPDDSLLVLRDVGSQEIYALSLEMR